MRVTMLPSSGAAPAQAASTGGGGSGADGGGSITRRSPLKPNGSAPSSCFRDALLHGIRPLVVPAAAVLVFVWAASPPTSYYGLSVGLANFATGGAGGSYAPYGSGSVRVAVFSAKGYDAAARKQERVLLAAAAADDDDPAQQQYDSPSAGFHGRASPLSFDFAGAGVQVLDGDEQRAYVRKHKGGGCDVDRYDELTARNQAHLATELWKYCAMWTTLSSPSSTWGTPLPGRRSAGGRRGGGAFADAALYIDRSSPLLVEWTEIVKQAAAAVAAGGGTAPAETTSIAVLSDRRYFPETIHGSFLYLTRDQASVAWEMLNLIQSTPVPVLEASPLLIQRTLYQRIAARRAGTRDSKATNQDGGSVKNRWYFLQQTCNNMDPLLRNPDRPSSDSHKVFTCPAKSEFCCSVRTAMPQSRQPIAADGTDSDPVVVMLNRHPALPFQRIVESMPRPYNAKKIDGYSDDELPYISTVREEVYERPSDAKESKNLYEVFLDKEILPKLKCRRCLSLRKCTSHETYCKDYMRNVCEEAKDLAPKFVSKRLTVTPPMYRRDPSRLVPRILHQTWYEDLDQAEYPNMSRLVESFKQSGWEYKFYSDADAEAFLETHFPPEVLEAYKALIPGAFKADLFRYCALLIYGGVYADVDILLESNLDLAIEPDIGFMVPMDEPDACVWQGFIAAAPGHPFLAKAIESVVNQVRNRFTGIDMDATFCPTPNFKVLHMFDVLFTAGPCLLGASMNRVLGRHGQTLLEPGELFPEDEGGASFVLVNNEEGGDPKSNSSKRSSSYSKIPGRTIILKQNKWDMGAHRFTMVEKNLVIAATDLENSDDRINKKAKKEAEARAAKEAAEAAKLAAKEAAGEDDTDESESDDDEKEEAEKTKDGGKEASSSGGGGGAHYSKVHARGEIYGLNGLYTDLGTVDEEIRVVIDASRQWKMMSSIESESNSASTT